MIRQGDTIENPITGERATFLETMFGLAAEGKINSKGMPNPFRLAVIMDEHFDLVRLPFPPAWVQRVGLALASPLGLRFGYEPGPRRRTPVAARS